MACGATEAVSVMQVKGADYGQRIWRQEGDVPRAPFARLGVVMGGEGIDAHGPTPVHTAQRTCHLHTTENQREVGMQTSKDHTFGWY